MLLDLCMQDQDLARV